VLGRRAACSTLVPVCERKRTGRPAAAASLAVQRRLARCTVSQPVGQATGTEPLILDFGRLAPLYTTNIRKWYIILRGRQADIESSVHVYVCV